MAYELSLTKDEILEVLRVGLRKVWADGDEDDDIPQVATYLYERLQEKASEKCQRPKRKSRSGKSNWAAWSEKKSKNDPKPKPVKKD